MGFWLGGGGGGYQIFKDLWGGNNVLQVFPQILSVINNERPLTN